MLQKCEQFTDAHGLKFNASKTQLVCFGRAPVLGCSHKFMFCGRVLPIVASAVHLGHILRADLDDSDDILKVTRDMARKANCMLVTFAGLDPFVRTKLFQSFCLSLYGSATWNLSCRGFKTVEVMFNNILRKIWRLPANSHTGILHCTARLSSIANIVLKRSQMLLHNINQLPHASVVHSVFLDSSTLSFTFFGLNCMHGSQYTKKYFAEDHICANVIRQYRHEFGTASSFEDVIRTLSCD